MNEAAGSSASLQDVQAGAAFVILTWNQRESTRRCLESIAGAGYSLARVVVWDNGSSDGTDRMVLADFPAVTYHHHPTNQGVASGRNSAALLAMRALAPTHLLFLDNDMVVTEGFLEALCEPFATEPRQAQAVAKIRLLGAPGHLHSAGGQSVSFALGIKRGTGYGERDTGQYDRRRECLPSGGATLVAADVFMRLDGFDAEFDPFGMEDLDFSLRVRRAGLQATYVPEAVVYHDYRRKTAERDGGASWIATRTRHWMVLLHRHASVAERVAFFLGGGLIGLARILVMQLSRGNPAALRGLATGVTSLAGESLRPGPVQEHSRVAGLETD